MIPIYQPYLSDKTLKYAHRAIDSGWISSQGEYLDLSKNKLKELLGCRRLILTNNGTSATHLLSLALKYKHPNITKLIVPDNVYVAAWNCFLYDKNYELIPVDSDFNTWNMDTSVLSNLIDENTAVLIVHNIGNVINVPKLKRKFPETIFLEDNCEGFLGKYEDKFTGTESFASSISFFGNKTITSGEGGSFITNDDDVFEYINKVKNQGQTNKKYIHDVLGYNYRMTNIQAAILYGQLEVLHEIKERKSNLFKLYRRYFEDIQNIEFQVSENNTEHSEWMFGIKFSNFDHTQKRNLEIYLYESGIETRPMFYDLTKHKHLSSYQIDSKNSIRLSEQCLLLPSHPELTNSQINYIANKIIDFLNDSELPTG